MARRRRFIDSRGRSYDRVARLRIEDHLWKAALLRALVERRGWKAVREGAVVPPGVKIYDWLCTLRKKYRRNDVPDILVAAMEAIPGWSWDPVRSRQVQMIDTLRAFVRRHGWGAVGRRMVVDGLPLGDWVVNLRQLRKHGEVPGWIARAVEAIPGWAWDPRTARHARKLDLLRRHIARHGIEGLHDDARAPDGTRIGGWAVAVRRLHRQGRLAPWLAEALEGIPGWSWERQRAGPASQWSAERVVRELRRLRRQGVQITGPDLRRRGRGDLLSAANTYAGGLAAARRLAGIPTPRRRPARRRRRRG